MARSLCWMLDIQDFPDTLSLKPPQHLEGTPKIRTPHEGGAPCCLWSISKLRHQQACFGAYLKPYPTVDNGVLDTTALDSPWHRRILEWQSNRQKCLVRQCDLLSCKSPSSCSPSPTAGGPLQSAPPWWQKSAPWLGSFLQKTRLCRNER